MLCVNCHQKQVIFLTLVQDCRNLLMAWMMLLDAGGTFWTRHSVVMVWFRHELIDVVMFCTQPKCESQIETKRLLHRSTIQLTSHLNRVRDYIEREMQQLRKCWIPLKEPQLQANPWQEPQSFLLMIFFGTTGNEMEQGDQARLRKDFQVGLEEWNYVLFKGQRICWMKDPESGPSIEVSQESAIEELEEVPVGKNAKEDLHCTPTMHTRYRSFLEQINWLQSRTQFQCCYKFSRCASKAAPPTIGEVKALNKLARQLKSQWAKLQFWPLTGPLRIIGFLDASYRNNEDGSSQTGIAVFFSRIARASSKNGMSCRSLVDYGSQKIRRTVLSTTVADLYSFMKCFGSCQFLRGLWMYLSGEVADIHMRTDAKNLVTTARTIHLPEQKGNNSHDFHVAKGSLFRK